MTQGKAQHKDQRIFPSIIVLLFIITALASCTRKKGNEYGLDIRETLRINIQTEPPSLDYAKSTDTTSNEININLMEALVGYDYNSPDLKPVPALAESWESSDKNKTWIFKIRKNVKWTDGVELKAQHFVDEFERLLNPKTSAQYAYSFYVLKNAREYFEGKVKDFSEVGVKAKDDYTLVFNLKSPASFFPYLLTHHTAFPLRKDVIEKYGDAAFSDPAKMVTIGPYKLKTWEHDKAIVLERNDDYYGEKAKIKYILAYMINEHATALNLFDSGKLDFIPEFASTEMSKQRQRPEFRSHPALTLQYYGFNVKKKPLDNVWLRKAIVASINREEVVKMLDGGQTPLTSWIPPGMAGYEPDIGIKYDPVKAKEYYAKAGYSDTKKPSKITIVFNTSGEHQKVAEILQNQIKRTLNIDVELANEEWKVFLNTLKVNAPHIYRFGWSADYPDPDNFLNLMTSQSANNHSNFKNKEFDQLIDKAVSEDDQSKRMALYAKAQKIMIEDDPVGIPLYSSVRSGLVSTRVENFPINPLNLKEYRKTSLKQ